MHRWHLKLSISLGLFLVSAGSLRAAVPSSNQDLYTVEDAIEKAVIPLFNEFVQYSNKKDQMLSLQDTNGGGMASSLAKLEADLELHRLALLQGAWQVANIEFTNTNPAAKGKPPSQLRDFVKRRDYGLAIEQRLAVGQYGVALDNQGHPLPLSKLKIIASSCLHFVINVNPIPSGF